MDKLINLLNKYDDACEYNIIDGEMKRRVKNFDNEQNTWKQVVWYTKQFGFIKWLVENKKIDEKKIDTRLVKYVESYYDEEGYWMENSYEDYSYTNTLLMLLAISDTPIDDLISYLK